MRHKLELILFFTLLTIYSFFVQYPNVNQNTRLDLARAIVEEHTITIDRYHENTVDKSYWNGHWYTDKAPGLSFLAAPVYAVLLALQPVADPQVWLGYPMHVLNAVVVAFPSALLVLLVLRWVHMVTGHAHRAGAVAVAFGLGTLALPFATLFFGHMTSAFLSFAAFYLLCCPSPSQGGGAARGDVPNAEHVAAHPILPPDRKKAAARLALAGFLAAAATVVEYPNAFIAGLLFLCVLMTATRKRNVVFYVLGLLPPLLLLMAYNMAAFGGPLQVSYIYSPTVQGLGLTQTRLPTLAGLWAVTFGPRGLFTLSPWLLLTIPGLITMFRRRDVQLQALLFTLIITGFGGLACLYYDQLGSVPGPRYLIPCLPFAAAAIGFTLPRWRWPFAVLAAISIALMFIVTAANPMAPMSVASPLTDYWLPAVARHSVVPTTLFLRFGIRSGLSLVILAVVLAIGAGAWLASLTLSGAQQKTVLAGCLVLAVVAYLALGFPIDLRQPFSIPQVIVGVLP